MSWNPFYLWANDGESEAEARARGEEASRKLAALNKEDALIYGPEWEQQVQANIERQEAALELTVDDEFDNGWEEAIDNDRQIFGNAISGATKSVFGIIPWQVYVIGLGVVAFLVIQQTGGIGRLLKKFK